MESIAPTSDLSIKECVRERMCAPTGRLTFIKCKFSGIHFLWWKKRELVMGIVLVFDLLELCDSCNIRINARKQVVAAFDVT